MALKQAQLYKLFCLRKLVVSSSHEFVPETVKKPVFLQSL